MNRKITDHKKSFKDGWSGWNWNRGKQESQQVTEKNSKDQTDLSIHDLLKCLCEDNWRGGKRLDENNTKRNEELKKDLKKVLEEVEEENTYKIKETGENGRKCKPETITQAGNRSILKKQDNEDAILKLEENFNTRHITQEKIRSVTKKLTKIQVKV